MVARIGMPSAANSTIALNTPDRSTLRDFSVPIQAGANFRLADHPPRIVRFAATHSAGIMARGMAPAFDTKRASQAIVAPLHAGRARRMAGKANRAVYFAVAD
jgi:hypothetical protein